MWADIAVASLYSCLQMISVLVYTLAILGHPWVNILVSTQYYNNRYRYQQYLLAIITLHVYCLILCILGIGICRYWPVPVSQTLLLVAPVNLFLAGTRNLKIPDINITNNLPIGQARFGENKIINIGLCCDIHVDVYGWTGIGALYFFMPKRN